MYRLHFLDYSRSYSQYGVLGICTFDTFYHVYFPGQGFLFYFLLAAYPFISHSIRKKAPLMLLPAERDFCPLSCLPPASHCSRNRHLPDALRKAGCRTSGHDPPRRAFWSAIGSFLPLQCQGCGWPADFMPALRGECACLCLADTSFRSPSLHVLLFHYCIWAKSQSFSAAKIVCGRERLDKP